MGSGAGPCAPHYVLCIKCCSFCSLLSVPGNIVNNITSEVSDHTLACTLTMSQKVVAVAFPDREREL